MIGLGIMGSAMAANLVKAGFEVHGYDPVAASRQRLRKAGGHACKSVAEVAQHSPHLLLSLPSLNHGFIGLSLTCWAFVIR